MALPISTALAELSIRVTPITMMTVPRDGTDKPARLSPGDALQSICFHPAGWIALRRVWNGTSEIWAGKPDAMHLVASASAKLPEGPERDNATLGNPMINANGQVVYATGKLFSGEGVWIWDAATGGEPRRLGGPEDDTWLRPNGSPLIDDAGTVWTFGAVKRGKSSVLRVPAGKPPEVVFQFGTDKVPGAANMLARSMYGHTRTEDPRMLGARMRLDAATGEVVFYTVLSLPEQDKPNAKVREGWMASNRPQTAWVGVKDGKARLVTLMNGSRASRSPAFDGLCSADGNCFGVLSWVEPVPGQPKGSARGERTRKGIGYMLAGGKSREVLGEGDKLPGTNATFKSLEFADMTASGMFACTIATDKGFSLLAGTKTKTHVVVAPGATLPGTSGPVTGFRGFSLCAGGTLLFVAEYEHPGKTAQDSKTITRLWAWREGESPVMVLEPSGVPLGVQEHPSRAGPDDHAREIFIDNAMHGDRRDDDIGQRQLYRVDYPVLEGGVDRRLLVLSGSELYQIEVRSGGPGDE